MKRQKRHKRGQAITEMVIGMVGLAVIFFALLQVGLLGSENIDNLLGARSDVDNKISVGFGTPDANYVGDWTAGADNLKYTQDDEERMGYNSVDSFREQLEYPIMLNLSMVNFGLADYDQISEQLDSGSIAVAANLRKGRKRSTVDVEPALQKLVTDTKRLNIESEVYMPALQLDD